MTDNNHPITLPPELVEQWKNLPEYTDGRRKITMVTLSRERLQEIADHSAQWGADQELEACCERVSQWCGWPDGSRPEDELRAARRPKPPSLKEQALSELNLTADPNGAELSRTQVELIRQALEQLPND